MPTSFQFGSREVTSRANVQTSVISATLSGLPSTMVPALSRVTEIICDTKRTVSCADAIARFRADQLGLVDRDEPGFGLLLVLLAILDHGLEALIDLGRQQILQRAAVAIGEGQHDHLVGAAGAARGSAGDRTRNPARRWRRAPAPAACPARPGPSSGRSAASTSAVGASGAWSITAPGIGTTLLSCAPLQHVARRAIVGRPLVSGALSEHVAQTQEDEDRQRQEDDGVNIHVAFAFWF